MIRNKILKRGAHPESEIQGCEKGRGRGRQVLVVVALAWLLTVAPLPWPVPSVMAATFTVNTTDDTADASPGDGVCADSAGRCSLRAAVMEANALGGGPHTIVLQAGQTYTLSKDTDGAGHQTDSGADNDDLDITSTIIIQGNGATIHRDPSLPCNLNGTPETGEFRIFEVKDPGDLTLDSVTVMHGCADGSSWLAPDGGGILSRRYRGALTIINSAILENRAAEDGGGIFIIWDRATIINSMISGNRARSWGGGIQNRGIMTITNSMISGNSALYAGGIENGDTVTIVNSTISGNSAGEDGGGIRNNGAFGPNAAIVINSTISENSAGDDGGGIYNVTNRQITIINSTISGNRARYWGGGMRNDGIVNLSFVTIANNVADTGGGIYGGTVNIKNSIVGNSTSGGDCSSIGTINASGVNFATDSSCGAIFTQVTSDQLNLGPLQVNPPGTTATHALLEGSVAIDAVTDCTDLGGNRVARDQRGVARPQGAQCDAGAFERGVSDFRLYLPLVLRMR